MTSVRRVGLAVVVMFALQGCGEDNGNCKTAQTDDKKETKEMCCKDNKPGKGKPTEDCCKNEKKEDQDKCLDEQVKKAAKAGSTAAGGTASAATTEAGKTNTGGSQLEVGERCHHGGGEDKYGRLAAR